MNQTLPKSRSYRVWRVRTVVVRLSRKLTATYRIRTGRLLSRLLTAMLSGLSTLATALPEGGNVVAGQASVSSPTANNMLVQQGSNKAILSWQSFNIGAGESVQFVQPDAASVTLNRVIEANPSAIYGSLSANGQVFLLNPAGVMFAPGAQVNVGGLVASSLAISNDDFLAGRYTFSGAGSGSVANHGNINVTRGGYVLLAGPVVGNTGTITTESGSIGLLAGSRVTLDTSGVGLVRFSVDAAAVNAAAANSGTLSAPGGQVAMLASALGDAMATVINQTGVIRANSATERNGMIVLSGGARGVVNVTGEQTATGLGAGQTGGTVKVLGDKVALMGGAVINVSGDVGAGTAMIGGDYQGKNPDVQNASRTFVGANSSIIADAVTSGNGGKVIVWADGDTRSGGSISARGGAASGDGGFVEVSGKQYLDTRGSIDVAAPNGTGGTVLFDPQDIVLSTAVSSPGAVANLAVNTPDLAFADAPVAGTYTVQISTVTGFDQLFLQASNNITVSNPLTMAANGSVRLEANNNINVNAGITVTGTGAINLRADADSSGAGTVALTNAALSAKAGGITLQGASVTSSNAASTITTTGAANANAGNVSITATGAVSLLGAITATGGTATAGNIGRNAGTVNIAGVGGVSTAAISAGGSNGGTGNTDGGNAGTITVSNSGTGDIALGALTARTGNAVGGGAGGDASGTRVSVSNTAATGTLSTGAITTTGGTKGHGGNVVLSSAGTATSGNIITSGGTTLTGNAGRNAGTVSITGAGVNRGASTITASGSAGVGTSQTGGNGAAISVTSTNGVTQTGAIAASGGGGSTTGGAGGNAGSITVTNTAAGAVSLGALTVQTGAAVGSGAGGTAGSINVSNAAGDLTTGALTTTGGINGNGGNITVAAASGTVVAGNVI
ncbi:beta strand repeat-containing protein, partial [Polaromonas sp.]|uniref:beta strand repeat-containing protein n=1 Tax=Polaromonas sp. TaxID=1869339 RepID=UPI003564DE87